MLLCAIERKKNNSIDELLILKKILFSIFPIVILSDISRELKEYLNEKNPEILTEVNKKALDFLFSFEFTSEIKEDMRETLTQKPNKIEEQIIEEARLYSAFIEITHNAQVFSYDYEHAIKGFSTAIEQQRKISPGFDELLSEKDHQKYLLSVRRLVHTKRWNRMKRFYPISVMEHQAMVGFIGYILAMLEKKSGNDYNMEHILKRALFHDIAESITGDVITPTKRIIPEFRPALIEAEQRMLEDRLFPIIPEVARADFRYFLTDETSRESKLVKHADNLCMLLETLIEVNVGNIPFRDIHLNFKKRLIEANIPSIDFFIKHVPDKFSDNLDMIFAMDK